MIKIALTGAAGRMGHLIIDEISRNNDLALVAAFDMFGEGETVANDVVITNPNDLAYILKDTKADVLIDFTIASASMDIICKTAELGIPLVVGTTGFSAEQLSRIKEAVDGKIAAVISPNYSLGVNVFWKLVEQAARSLSSYDVEVIEAHHNQKKDAPSGTASKTVDILKSAMSIDSVVHGRDGFAMRGREIGVHAVRAGDIVGDHLVLFAGPGERLEIKHQAHSRAAFASGAVRAARWVVKAGPGIHSMAEVLS